MWKSKSIKNLFLYLTVISLIFSSFIVEGRAQGNIILSTTYPGITVKAGEDIEVSLRITNNGTNPQNVELSIVSIPKGWKGFFEGRGRTVHRVFVNEKDYESVDFSLEIPSDTKEEDYQEITEKLLIEVVEP